MMMENKIIKLTNYLNFHTYAYKYANINYFKKLILIPLYPKKI